MQTARRDRHTSGGSVISMSHVMLEARVAERSREAGGCHCDEYGADEEALLITALAASLDNVDEHNIGDTTCADASRRRRLLGAEGRAEGRSRRVLSLPLADEGPACACYACAMARARGGAQEGGVPRA